MTPTEPDSSATLGVSVAYCNSKTKAIARWSAEAFIKRNEHSYFITFTKPGKESEPAFRRDKTESEEQFKPFKDLVRRRGGEFLDFWELQQRGVWHVHVLVNIRFNAKWLRAWMMARGWGQQMKIRYVRKHHGGFRTDGASGSVSVESLVRYLVKYLTKCHTEEPRKKFFGGSQGAKIGTTKFNWIPSVSPYAMLYYYGRQVWWDAFGERPRFEDIGNVIATGVEAVNWLSVDPWYMAPLFG